jgi:hypothetical protein
MKEAAMSYKENVDENLFGMRSLAFALLQCRSEKEALLVIKYFAKPKPRVTAPPEHCSGPDGFSGDTD